MLTLIETFGSAQYVNVLYLHSTSSDLINSWKIQPKLYLGPINILGVEVWMKQKKNLNSKELTFQTSNSCLNYWLLSYDHNHLYECLLHHGWWTSCHLGHLYYTFLVLSTFNDENNFFFSSLLLHCWKFHHVIESTMKPKATEKERQWVTQQTVLYWQSPLILTFPLKQTSKGLQFSHDSVRNFLCLAWRNSGSLYSVDLLWISSTMAEKHIVLH